MSTVAAISITEEETIVVTGERGREGLVHILGLNSVPTPELLALSRKDHPDGKSAEVSQQTWTSGEEASSDALSSLPNLPPNITSSIAVAAPQKVLYKKSVLPFFDQKKVDQILPLQLQDTLPFDVDDFVISNRILGTKQGTEHPIISTLMPVEEVGKTLAAASALGLEPKILTTRSSALAALALAHADRLGEVCGILAAGSGYCSLALIAQNNIVLLRDFPLSEAHTPLSSSHISHIKSSLKAAEQECGQKFPLLYVVADSQTAQLCAKELSCNVRELPLGQLLINRTSKELDAGEVFWALGIISAETSSSKSLQNSLINLRKGSFAYQPVWGNLWAAIKEELLFFILFAVFLTAWCFTLVYNTSQSLSAVNKKITEMVSLAIPEEKLPTGGEVSEIEERVSKIEDQLRGIGSLSSLSPLETLRELSQVIGPDIDLDLDSLSIGHSRLTFRGTVPNHPTTGVLEEVLKKQKEFCSVNITPMGSSRGSRVSFSAEIGICE